MYDMANVQWTASQKIDYSFNNKSLVYQPGQTYLGMIYNNNKTGLEKYMTILDESGKHIGTDFDWDHSPGNSCATSIEHALQLVSPVVEYSYSADMMPYYANTGILALGNINWGAYDGKNTKKSLVPATEAQDHYEAFALTLPGDCLVRYLDKEGHAQMVTLEPKVERKEDGSIDPNKSMIYITDQTNSMNNSREYPSTWNVDKGVTFAEARTKGYLPVTIAALQEGKTPAPYIEFADGPTEQDLEMSTLNGVITSNYKVMTVRAEITKGKDVVASASCHPYEKEVMLDAISPELKMWELPKGKYTLTVTVEAGLGSEVIMQTEYKKADAEDLAKKYDKDGSLVQVELVDVSTVDDLKNSNIRGTVNCNYSMLTVLIEAIGADGEVAASVEVNPCSKTYLLNKVSQDMKLWELPAGDYTVKIQIETEVGFQTIMEQEYTKAS